MHDSDLAYHLLITHSLVIKQKGQSMFLILLGLALTSLPLILSTSFSKIVVLSIYVAIGNLAFYGAAFVLITGLVRRHRIAEWRKHKIAKQLF